MPGKLTKSRSRNNNRSAPKQSRKQKTPKGKGKSNANGKSKSGKTSRHRSKKRSLKHRNYGNLVTNNSKINQLGGMETIVKYHTKDHCSPYLEDSQTFYTTEKEIDLQKIEEMEKKDAKNFSIDQILNQVYHCEIYHGPPIKFKDHLEQPTQLQRKTKTLEGSLLDNEKEMIKQILSDRKNDTSVQRAETLVKPILEEARSNVTQQLKLNEKSITSFNDLVTNSKDQHTPGIIYDALYTSLEDVIREKLNEPNNSLEILSALCVVTGFWSLSIKITPDNELKNDELNRTVGFYVKKLISEVISKEFKSNLLIELYINKDNKKKLDNYLMYCIARVLKENEGEIKIFIPEVTPDKKKKDVVDLFLEKDVMKLLKGYLSVDTKKSEFAKKCNDRIKKLLKEIRYPSEEKNRNIKKELFGDNITEDQIQQIINKFIYNNYKIDLKEAKLVKWATVQGYPEYSDRFDSKLCVAKV